MKEVEKKVNISEKSFSFTKEKVVIKAENYNEALKKLNAMLKKKNKK